jgi:hypothetical protein
MNLRIWACAALLALLACTGAQAAPVTVNLRVEGSSATIFEAPVTTDGKVITKGGNTLTCDGTIDPGNPGPGPTVTSALDDGLLSAGIPWEASFFNDFFVNSIAGEAKNATQSWGYALNYRSLEVGGCQQQVANADEVLFAYDFFGGPPDYTERPLLRLSGPGKAAVGQPVALSVDQFTLPPATGGPRDLIQGPAAGAAVAGTQTDGSGAATVTFTSPGLQRLKAERGGSIRSNSVLLCVSDTGTGDCGIPGQLGSTADRGRVTDSAAPVARISGPRNGRRYRRGPRLLKGTVGDDPSGVREVKIALRRKVPGRSCQWWSGRRERFVGTHCRKVFFFSIGSNRNWSYLLPRALPRGRYVLDVKAFDGRRNRDERFVSGQNRVEFQVVSRKSRGTTRAARAGRRAARVQVMVVGERGTVVEATTLRARATVVRASGRACKVSQSTPLAALVAALDRQDVGRHVRDFGACERRRAGSSSQLFVDRIAKERNRGEDGWVYKVNDFARDVGAADISAPRLRDGDRVLWLYCVLNPKTRSCQPSLRLLPDASSGPPGGAVRVRVRAYDNERRHTPAAGARVTLGPAAATTGADGIATLNAPAKGRHTLAASAPDALPSFPLRYDVK